MIVEPLRPGDPVTLLLPDHVVMVEVHTSSRTDFTVQLSARGGEKTYTSRWELHEEGSGWLRGYHTADSREVCAARAAKGLEPVPALTGAQGPIGTHYVPNPAVVTYGQSVSSSGSVVVIQDDFRRFLEEMKAANK